MNEQNFSNHTRYHPLFHYVLAPLAFAGLVGSVVNLMNCEPAGLYSASLLVIAFVLIFILGMLVRTYALKAQDRAIRAEENFRHFLLTGKPLDARLRTGQIVALRFASDAELPSLAQKAAEEKLGSKAIKSAIKQWKADHYRI
jgi:hypothetical protein